ncbi:hypothetical protein SBOR_3462 [Sclerotinia borealis F-4128]|uniref:Inheritance of peroxisomes protein 1 n=1 Tax=Sclerotinia borealis (strain F-4128) TaxID=1432307 RepID=W9CHF4_SCLBF|nr:hypothetical protein SBOR_3462 [Sclerotinia borealis F-4128]
MTSTSSVTRAVSVSGRLSSGPDPQIEILYSVDGARIVSFSTLLSGSSRPSSSNGSAEEDTEIGSSLRWSSPVERTIAVGTLCIYRAPESVAFFNCQKALKPILPRSQCWFISDEGSSKFVLQVRKLQEYWRIEIANTTSEEVEQAEEFKRILAQVLLYEKTPCPFQRTFSVDLPIAPQIPQKPWRPVQRSSSKIPLPRGDLYPIASKSTSLISLTSSSPKLSCTEIRSSSLPQTPESHQSASSPTATCISDLQFQETPETSSAKSTSLTLQSPIYPPRAHWAEPHPTEHASSPSELKNPVVSHIKFDEGDNSDATDDDAQKRPIQPSYPQLPPESKNRPQALHYCTRSITAPPVLYLIASPPSKRRNISPVRKTAVGDPDSELSSSVESFHSTQSWQSPLDAPLSPPLSGPPSPATFPYPHDNIVLPKQVHSTQALSQLTITPEIHAAWHTPSPNSVSPRCLSPTPKTPTLINDGERSEDDTSEIITPSPPRLRHRGTTSSNSGRRSLSPLPAAMNLFSPPRSRRLQTARHLPTAIIQKTCEILLSPPSHLLHMMINIASKIAAGEWRGVLLGEGEAVHWDFTEEEYRGGSWTEDDFGFSLTPTPSRRRISSSQSRDNTTPGESWEVD